MTLSLLRRLRRDDRGVAFVEFAITLPIMLFLFAVMVEGGRLMWSYQSVIAGVRDATRYIGRVTPSDICVTGGSIAAAHDEQAEDMVMAAGVAGGDPEEGLVRVLDVRAALDECPAAATPEPFRVARVATITVEADLEVSFPFAGLFTLVGAEIGTITTTITDQTRVFGA